MEEIETGIVKFFDLKRGFGFIKQDSAVDDLYFHITDLWTGSGDAVVLYPDAGDRVSYMIGFGKQGLCARKIRVIQEQDLPGI